MVLGAGATSPNTRVHAEDIKTWHMRVNLGVGVCQYNPRVLEGRGHTHPASTDAAPAAPRKTMTVLLS